MRALAEVVGATMLLSETMLHDTAMMLAVAGEWLDPLYNENLFGDETWDDPIEDECEFWQIRRILREHFPEVYAEFNYQYHYAPISTEALSMWFLDRLNKEVAWHGELWDIDQMPWIPHYWLGAGMHSEGFFESSRAAFIARMLAVEDGNWAYSCADNAAAQLCRNAPPKAEALMQWLFSSSGNTVLDFDDEEAGENGVEPPRWEEYDQFKEVYQEADEMFGQVLEYITELESDTAIFTEFCSNLLIAYAAGIQEDFHASNNYRPELEWNAANRASDRREADFGVVFLPAGDISAAA